MELAPDPFPGCVSQAFQTRPGQEYELRFYAASGRNHFLKVSVGDLNTNLIPDSEFPKFSPVILEFKAASVLSTLTFTATEEESFGPLIDGVSVSPR